MTTAIRSINRPLLASALERLPVILCGHIHQRATASRLCSALNTLVTTERYCPANHRPSACDCAPYWLLQCHRRWALPPSTWVALDSTRNVGFDLPWLAHQLGLLTRATTRPPSTIRLAGTQVVLTFDAAVRNHRLSATEAEWLWKLALGLARVEQSPVVLPEHLDEAWKHVRPDRFDPLNPLRFWESV